MTTNQIRIEDSWLSDKGTFFKERIFSVSFLFVTSDLTLGVRVVQNENHLTYFIVIDLGFKVF